MLIKVDRFASDDDATLSRVWLDEQFVCFGLEDEYRATKIPGETRIPAGRYRVGMRTVGGFHGRYSRIFGAAHHGMLEICDVPGFRWILLHCGNTDDDTAGCLLVGTGCVAEHGSMTLTSSRRAYLHLYSLAVEAAIAGSLTIDFWDHDVVPPRMA